LMREHSSDEITQSRIGRSQKHEFEESWLIRRFVAYNLGSWDKRDKCVQSAVAPKKDFCWWQRFLEWLQVRFPLFGRPNQTVNGV
jgi:hypothetical protein